VWGKEGEQSNIADYRIKDVDTLQQGLIGLAWYVEGLDW
jgi:hypothetical protein